YIYSKIEDSASAIALDGGILFGLNDKLTFFALAFQNAGTGLQYDQTSESLPFVFKAAVSRILFENLLVDVDIDIPSDNDIFPAFGAEYKLNVNQYADLFIRAGYSFREKDLPGFAGFNAGFGARFADYTFDYAFSPYGDLGSAHRISAGIRFGETVSKRENEKPKKTKRTIEKRSKPKEQTLPGRASSARQTFLDEQASEPSSTRSGGVSVSQQTQTEQETEYYGGYEEEKDVKEVAKNAGSALVLELSSQQISQNEKGVYTEMLRNAILNAKRFKVFPKHTIENVYSKNSMPSRDELIRIFKQTGAEIVVCGNIEKTGKTQEFKLYVYDENLNEKEFSFRCEDSFRAVKNNLQEVAQQF
ncbi:MAG: hypothetical protein LBO62_02350, partial [Endomicrobium sp.]|nr:hypothetical protein [Endomicrobium sp.]